MLKKEVGKSFFFSIIGILHYDYVATVVIPLNPVIARTHTCSQPPPEM